MDMQDRAGGGISEKIEVVVVREQGGWQSSHT